MPVEGKSDGILQLARGSSQSLALENELWSCTEKRCSARHGCASSAERFTHSFQVCGMVGTEVLQYLKYRAVLR